MADDTFILDDPKDDAGLVAEAEAFSQEAESLGVSVQQLLEERFPNAYLDLATGGSNRSFGAANR